MKVETNTVFRHLERSSKRITVEQGGSRSGKSYNILLWLIFSRCSVDGNGNVITIVRKSFPALRGSIYRDFIDIMMKYGLYNESDHNKSNSEYRFNNWLFEFISLDQPQKVRGRKRHTAFLNEGNELNLEDYRQVALRTTDKIIIDYNPSDEYHWLYDEVIPRSDCDFYQTTYLNNPFLEQGVIDEIERYKSIDEDFWRIYGLGERGQSKARIFQFIEIEKIPAHARAIGIGLDFGFTNDPTTIVQSFIEGDNLYLSELCYATQMTNADISRKIKEIGIAKTTPIYADSAEPKSIEEIYRMGHNIKPTAKGKDSINIGIDMMRRYRIHVTTRSYNLIKELKNYKWQEDKNGHILNTPVDAWNHCIDASRYSIYNILARPDYGKYAVR